MLVILGLCLPYQSQLHVKAEDIKSTYEDLKKKRVNITPPEKQEWGGVISTLKDQDGNGFYLVEFKM